MALTHLYTGWAFPTSEPGYRTFCGRYYPSLFTILEEEVTMLLPYVDCAECLVRFDAAQDSGHTEVLGRGEIIYDRRFSIFGMGPDANPRFPWR